MEKTMKFKNLFLSLTLLASFAGVRAMDNGENNNPLNDPLYKYFYATSIVYQGNPNNTNEQLLNTTMLNVFNALGHNAQSLQELMTNLFTTFGQITQQTQQNTGDFLQQTTDNAFLMGTGQMFMNIISLPNVQNVCDTIINSQNNTNNQNQLNNQEENQQQQNNQE